MNVLMNKLKTAYGFSEYEISLIRYTLTALLYDFSKLAVFGIYYYCTGKFISFLFAMFPLILLRTKTGGIHFKKYWICFLFTFAYLELSINILPGIIYIHPLGICLILLLCAVFNYLLGPNSLNRKTPKSSEYIKKARTQTILLIMIIEILLCVFPENKYLVVSFWTVILHTVQLAVTKLLKEVRLNEKVVE